MFLMKISINISGKLQVFQTCSKSNDFFFGILQNILWCNSHRLEISRGTVWFFSRETSTKVLKKVTHKTLGNVLIFEEYAKRVSWEILAKYLEKLKKNTGKLPGETTTKNSWLISWEVFVEFCKKNLDEFLVINLASFRTEVTMRTRHYFLAVF